MVEVINLMVRISNHNLIRLLMENARASYVEIAEKLGVSEAAVRKRIKRLEDLGVIRRYTIDLDPRLRSQRAAHPLYEPPNPLAHPS